MTTTTTATPNVQSVRGGKVHRGTPGYDGMHGSKGFPRCRTGAMSNSCTVYRPVTLKVTCSNCLGTGTPAAEVPSYAQTITAVAQDYRQAKTNGRIAPATHDDLTARAIAAGRAAGISRDDALDDLFDEVAAPPARKN